MRVAVHEIPEAAERLPQDEGRREQVRQTQEGDRLPACIPERRTDPPQHTAMDRQSPMPDRRDLPGKAAVVRPVEEHIIQPRPDDPCKDREEDEVHLFIFGQR